MRGCSSGSRGASATRWAWSAHSRRLSQGKVVSVEGRVHVSGRGGRAAPDQQAAIARAPRRMACPKSAARGS
eukprot:scaffold124266_cov33-Tisochrysis_lutea.AAC.3